MPAYRTRTHARACGQVHRTMRVCVHTYTPHIAIIGPDSHAHGDHRGPASARHSHELRTHTLVQIAVTVPICLNTEEMTAHGSPHSWCSHTHTHTHTPSARPLSHISSSVSQGGGHRRPRPWPIPTPTPPGSGWQETSRKSRCLGGEGGSRLVHTHTRTLNTHAHTWAPPQHTLPRDDGTLALHTHSSSHPPSRFKCTKEGDYFGL